MRRRGYSSMTTVTPYANSSQPGETQQGATASLGVGVVVIGRNEGERLDTCLRSAIGGRPVVYVDSGSTDSSTSIGRAAGAEVVNLDMSVPFTAARARNEGCRRLRSLSPQLAYVQFVDGDCEIDRDWIATASAFLDGHADVGVVCGRRRERYPERSIYNRLCDREWDTPVGEAKACGGDALIRLSAFEQAGGYRDNLIAGEEPELCFRLRQSGWKIWRLDAEMTLHDVAMLRFGQWWKRHVRSGYAFAQGACLHGRSPERYWVWETVRALIWGSGIPLISLVALASFGARGLFPLLLYPLQFARRIQKQPGDFIKRCQYAAFELLARFPESIGVWSFVRDRLLGRRARLIEYK